MIDPQMPEPDGRAETNKERHPEGGYTFDEVPAWSEPLVRAYAEALAAHRVALAVAAERERCAVICEQEICPCCFDEDATAVAEHLAAEIRNQPPATGKEPICS